MMESEKFEDFEKRVGKLDEEVDEEGVQDLIELYRQGLATMSSNHLEASLLCFCSVIEGVISLRREGDFDDFYKWLKKKDRIEELIASNEDELKSNMDDLYRAYKADFGARRNFAQTISDAYREKGKIPAFMSFESFEHNGVTTTTNKLRNFENKEEAYEELEKISKEIYDSYRSDLLHRGERLSPLTDIKTRIGSGSYSAKNISLQDIADLALTVLESEIS